MFMLYTLLWLKMVSYVQVNYWCRQKSHKSHKTKKMSEYFSQLMLLAVWLCFIIVEDNEYIKKQNLVWYPDNLNYRGMFVSLNLLA